MYYFTNPNKFANRNRYSMNRNTSVRISEGLLYNEMNRNELEVKIKEKMSNKEEVMNQKSCVQK